MTAIWGAINLALGLKSPSGDLHLAPFREFLAFNLGLNLGYVGVGLAMALNGRRSTLQLGFGVAVVVQGLILFLLDGLLWLRVPRV